MTQSMKKATRSLDKQPQKQQQQQQRAYMEYKTIPFCRHHFIFCVYTSYTPTNYLTLYLALTFSIFYATIHLVLLTMAIALDEWVHTYIYMCVCLCCCCCCCCLFTLPNRSRVSTYVLTGVHCVQLYRVKNWICVCICMSVYVCVWVNSRISFSVCFSHEIYICVCVCVHAFSRCAVCLCVYTRSVLSRSNFSILFSSFWATILSMTVCVSSRYYRNQFQFQSERATVQTYILVISCV